MADQEKTVVKNLDLYRHTEKDKKTGKHASYDGLDLAYNAGGLYSPAEVDHAFHGPLIRTSESLIGMMAGNEGFKHTEIHDPVDGLGSDEVFTKLKASDAFAEAIKHDASVFEATLKIEEMELAQLENAGREALNEMFSKMEEGSLGVGVFHDPTIPVLAASIGMKNARSLNPMERIRFSLHEDGHIEASFPDDAE